MSQTVDERLMLLYRLAQDLNASLNPDEVLERVMDDVITVTGAERGFLLLNGSTAFEEKEFHVGAVTRGMERDALGTQEFHVSRTLVKQVFESGQPVLTSDAGQDTRFNQSLSIVANHVRSILCVPMKSKRGVMGAIYVDSRFRHGVFTEKDTDLLMAIAATAATAMENARLYFETENRLRTLDLLHQISQEITSTLDLDRVLHVTTQAVKELLHASAASILTVDGDALTFQVAIGESSSAIKPFRVQLGQGIAGWVVENKQPVIVNDAQNDPRFFGTMDKKTGFSTQSLIAVPLCVNEKAIGVIEVFNKPGGFSGDDLELLATFASSAAFAIENARLYQVAVDKGRMERELQVARDVQANLLPQETPQFPGWEMSGRWLPAREVAGDYYDFVQLEMLPDRMQKLGLVIADVADKGIPAALFMVDVRSTLRASMFDAESPVHGLTHVNQLVSNDAHNGMFVTLFYAQVSAWEGNVVYVNAGHNPPFVIRAGGGDLEILSRTGMALGIDPEVLYTQQLIHMFPGDLILFYTDGVPDALNAAGQEFGIDRLREIALASRGKSAAEVVDALESALKAHIGETIPFDDITIMVLKRE